MDAFLRDLLLSKKAHGSRALLWKPPALASDPYAPPVTSPTWRRYAHTGNQQPPIFSALDWSYLFRYIHTVGWVGDSRPKAAQVKSSAVLMRLWTAILPKMSINEAVRMMTHRVVAITMHEIPGRTGSSLRNQ